MATEDRKAVNSITRRVTLIADPDFDRISVHLRSLGLVESGVKRRQISDSNKYLRLTSLGQQELARLIAVTKADESEAKKPSPKTARAKKATPTKAAAKKATPTKAPTKTAAKKVAVKGVPAKKA